MTEAREKLEDRAIMDERNAARLESPQVRHAGQVPLTGAQSWLWSMQQAYPASRAYHTAVSYELHGHVHVAAMSAAFTEVIRRHEALRSVIATAPDGTATMVVCPPVPVELPVTPVPVGPARERLQAVRQVALEHVRRPFDLGHSPLARGELLRLGEEDHVLLLTSHLIVADERTMQIAAEELAAIYTALVSGNDPSSELPALPAQFSDYAWRKLQTLTGELVNRQLVFWTGQLAAVSPLVLPSDRPRAAVPDLQGRRTGTRLGALTVHRLREAARTSGVTDFVMLITCLVVALSRYANEDDVAIGALVADRSPEFGQVAGCFISPLVLRVDCGDDPPLTGLLARVSEVAEQAYQHRDVPLHRLTEALAPAGDPDQPPLFTVAVSCRGGGPSPRFAGLSAVEFELPADVALSELDVCLADYGGEIAIEFRYRRELFDEPTILGLLGLYVRTLEAAAQRPETAISKLSAAGPDQLTRLISIGSRPVAHPVSPLVHELVRAWAVRAPDAPAVRDGFQTLSYADLDARAEALAGRLRDLGVRRDVIVGVLLGRSVGFVVALLAVLKAGGAYLPLDPSYPDDRLLMMLDDSAAPLVITSAESAGRLSASAPATVLLSGGPPEDAPQATVGPVPAGDGRDLAYVIYTSGSTGRPKGVAVEHRSMLNLCHWHIREYGLTSADRGTMIAAQGFDASVWELWPYLAVGASVSIADEATRTAAADVARWMIGEQATVSFLPTPLAEAVLETDLAARLPVRALLTGGELLTRRPQPGLPYIVVNHYGPTECTVVATAGPVEDRTRAQGPVAIGRPIDNVEVLILGKSLDPVPFGATGELYLGGAGLARGYLNQPQMTANRFVPNPFGPPGARLYRTGDLARWKGDSTLEFLGRADRQVKVRGYRIEPGEIEASLQEHPAVRQALVIPYRTRDGDQALAAYFVTVGRSAADPAELAEIAGIRRWLRQRLPAYMIPAVYIHMAEFPTTPSGKLDRARLPSPVDQPNEKAEFVAPRDELEASIAALFGEVLGGDRVGIHDNFGDLGGHSLAGARLIARVDAELGMKVPATTIIAHPTVAAFASALAELAAQEEDA